MRRVICLCCLLAAVVPLRAQSQPPTPAASDAAGPSADPLQARYQIAVMEAVLESAVLHGAQTVRRQIQSLAPDMLLFAGPPRARGFLLDGYGVFFAVDVPALRRSLAWSFRMLEQANLGIDTALQSLRRHVESIGDARARQDLDQALKRLEIEVTPSAMVAAASGAAPDRPASEGRPGEATGQVRADDLANPEAAYTAEVKRALIDAMLDHSGPITIGPNEWLTLAARHSDGDTLPTDDPYETATIVMRIRGSDLAAFRADRITRDQARRRVEVKEF